MVDGPLVLVQTVRRGLAANPPSMKRLQNCPDALKPEMKNGNVPACVPAGALWHCLFRIYYRKLNAKTARRPCMHAFSGGRKGNSSEENFGGENFVRGNFRHTSSFGAGPSDTGNFDTPSLWFLVDNRLCETLVGPNFEQYQLIRDKTEEQTKCTNILDDNQLLTPEQAR